MKYALKQRPMFITMDPVLVSPRLNLLELETRVRMKGEPPPIFSWHYKVANKESFCGACQVKDPDHLVHFPCANGTDWAYVKDDK